MRATESVSLFVTCPECQDNSQLYSTSVHLPYNIQSSSLSAKGFPDNNSNNNEIVIVVFIILHLYIVAKTIQ